MYGLKSQDIDSILGVIQQVSTIDQVILYGSRAMEAYRLGSDIDLTIIGKGLTLQNTIYPLMDLLEDLYLPYSFDLSIYEHISDQAVIDHIQRVGITLYKRELLTSI